MIRYSTTDDVKIYLSEAVKTEDTEPASPYFLDPNPVSLYDTDIELYIAQADQYINGEIGTIYMVPLKMVNMGGVVSFPSPIPSISARLAAKFIWEQRLTGADKAGGEFIENHYKQAMAELNEIVRGNRRLIGQNSQMGSRFSRSSWHHIPPYPAKEPPQAGQI